MTLREIADNGIVGAGGAGFPAHVKLAARPEFLIVNAAECEPLLHKDGEILKSFAPTFLDGCVAAKELCGAKSVIIGIKRKYGDTIASLTSRLPGDMSIVALDDFYPAGDEVTLIYKITGRIVQPGSLPITCGCVVQNVETLYNIGRNKPVTGKFLTIAGAVEKPVTLEVPVGMSLRELLSNVAITVPDYAVVAGGVMMGYVEDDLDSVITKRSGGFIILPSDHYVARTHVRSRNDANAVRLAKSSCDQCSYCTELCPRYLLGHPVRPELAMRNRQFTMDNDQRAHAGNAFCCDCNLCTLYACPEDLDPRGACRIENPIIKSSGRKWTGPSAAAAAHPMVSYRATPVSRLKERIGIARYEDHAPLAELKKQPSKVTIPLAQHIGAPAVPCVGVGNKVAKGDCIGKADGAISAPVHASIDGTVKNISASAITLIA
jgi:Na+-translocating ferredoxin:NAD+ oxidoreductase RnfC subunit